MVYSMDSPYGIHSGYGMKKWLGTQPKNSPYGIHMELPGECKDLCNPHTAPFPLEQQQRQGSVSPIHCPLFKLHLPPLVEGFFFLHH